MSRIALEMKLGRRKLVQRLVLAIPAGTHPNISRFARAESCFQRNSGVVHDEIPSNSESTPGYTGFNEIITVLESGM